MDRRGFLKQSAATAAGAAALAAVSTRRASAKKPSANEIINIGVIGCGGRGMTHVRRLVRMGQGGDPVRVVAVCDVWEKRLEEAVAYSGAKPYKDYRKLLENKDVDAVCIATPHHWHARMILDSAEAEKDIFCEKPMTHWKSFEDPVRVMKAVARYKRVMQVGTNGMSDSIWEQTRKRVLAGALGQLIQAQASDMRNHYIDVYDPRRRDPDAKPGVNLDWEMWLGPAPKRRWDPGRFFAFRVFWDYASGITTDFFPHLLTPLVWVMGLRYPKRVVSSGGLYHYHDGRQTPDIITVSIEYPGGPSVLLMGSVVNDTNLPKRIRGTKATLTYGGPGAVIEPQRYLNPNGKREEIKRVRGESLDEFWREFFNCVKTRQKPRSNEIVGCHVTMALNMAVHSYLKGRAMEFDPKRERPRFC